MNEMTRGVAKFFLRNQVGKELKDVTLLDGMLDKYFDWARRDVQDDLLPLAFDFFKTTGFFEGNIFNLPSDLKPVPDNVKWLMASSGTKAAVTTNMNGTNNDMVITAREPGTPGNTIVLTIVQDDTQGETPLVSVSGKTITVNVNLTEGSFGSANGVISAVKNNLLANEIAELTLAAGNDGTGEVRAGSWTTVGGTGAGWKIADEITDWEYNYIITTPEDVTRTPNAARPKYAKFGVDTNMIKQVKMLPTSTKYIKASWVYTLPNLTSDNDLLGIPADFENVCIAYAIKYVYEGLQMQNKVTEQEQYIQNLYAKKKINYKETIGSITEDKNRKESE